jgi:hypothetical protein
MRWDCLQIYNSRDSRSNDRLRFLSRRLDVVLISAAQRPKGLTSSRLVCLLMFDTLKLTILKHSLTSSLWKWVPAWFAAFLCRGSPPYICFIISNWHRRQMVLNLTGWALMRLMWIMWMVYLWLLFPLFDNGRCKDSQHLVSMKPIPTHPHLINTLSESMVAMDCFYWVCMRVGLFRGIASFWLGHVVLVALFV